MSRGWHKLNTVFAGPLFSAPACCPRGISSSFCPLSCTVDFNQILLNVMENVGKLFPCCTEIAVEWLCGEDCFVYDVAWKEMPGKQWWKLKRTQDPNPRKTSLRLCPFGGNTAPAPAHAPASASAPAPVSWKSSLIQIKWNLFAKKLYKMKQKFSRVIDETKYFLIKQDYYPIQLTDWAIHISGF